MPTVKLPGFDQLAPLATFDPEAFIDDDMQAQHVCNFVLSLALIYNDFKNLMWAFHYLSDGKPENPDKISAYGGQYAAFKNHLLRLHFSVINELFQLIEDNANILAHPTLVETIRLLPKAAKECWQALVEVSTKKDTKNKFIKDIFHRVRNKITYHSDVKEIAAGYRSFFYGSDGHPKMQAFISMGDGLSSTRFYFADAVVEGYLNLKIGTNKPELIKQSNKLFTDVNVALNLIVKKFITVRGFAWRKYE